MKRFARLILLMLFSAAMILSACTKKSKEPICDGFELVTPTLIEDRDYQVIITILESEYPNLKEFILKQKIDSIGEYTIDFIKQHLEYEQIELDTMVLEDYASKNAAVWYFSGEKLPESFQLLPYAELQCIFSAGIDGWDSYYEKYGSDGYFSFTHPGYNQHGDVAMVEYGWFYGSLGASGFLVILENKEGQWEVTHHIYTWISRAPDK